ncbi:MAG: DUF1905 domain-containing protein [Flavobacteriales bacterium]
MPFRGVPYKFTTKPWQYEGKGAWIFVTLPEKLSNEIRKNFRHEEEGWGRLKVIALIGKSEWPTAIWFDTKRNTYLLPLKVDIRRKENVEVNSQVEITVFV